MTRFATLILAWYARHARPLPWRDHVDPYRTWISEVMLQQTRVETVLPYFDRWMARFPTVERLAAASEHAVLLLWEGLGYYSRARNLHRAARLVVRDFGGQLPANASALTALPGVGRYTAAAISSMAFGRDEPALDGNVRRVLARVFHVEAEAGSKGAEKRLLEVAARHLPKGMAGDFNQALMDLGATVCLARRPQCSICPVDGLCRARLRGTQAQLPMRAPRAEIPHLMVGAVLLRRRDRILIAKRASQGLLGGLWEFPKVKLGRSQQDPRSLARRLPAALRDAYAIEVYDPRLVGVVQHAYSHFRVTVHAFRCRTWSPDTSRNLRWARIDRLYAYPMGKVDRRIAERSKAWLE